MTRIVEGSSHTSLQNEGMNCRIWRSEWIIHDAKGMNGMLAIDSLHTCMMVHANVVHQEVYMPHLLDLANRHF